MQGDELMPVWHDNFKSTTARERDHQLHLQLAGYSQLHHKSLVGTATNPDTLLVNVASQSIKLELTRRSDSSGIDWMRSNQEGASQ